MATKKTTVSAKGSETQHKSDVSAFVWSWRNPTVVSVIIAFVALFGTIGNVINAHYQFKKTTRPFVQVGDVQDHLVADETMSVMFKVINLANAPAKVTALSITMKVVMTVSLPCETS